MSNKAKLQSALQELRTDNRHKQKLGLHFILASVFIWVAVLAIQLSSLPILTKNLLTFCCSTPLVPLAYLFSKILKIDFQNRENPLSGLGLLLSLNQMLYLLIAMWVYAAVPEKMLMVYAMIFGAHLLPYGWLYQSKSYYFFSLAIPIAVLLIGICCPPAAIAIFMLIVEIIFCMLLVKENRHTK
ncbi:MAG: hypothetical protein OSJ72_12485 [Lachnospiraceae bacterium]|nr:hypothetical protein [Lachnospiraceae bacterium]